MATPATVTFEGVEHTCWSYQQLEKLGKEDLTQRALNLREGVGKDWLPSMPRHVEGLIKWVLEVQVAMSGNEFTVMDFGMPKEMAGGPPASGGGMPGQSAPASQRGLVASITSTSYEEDVSSKPQLWDDMLVFCWFLKDAGWVIMLAPLCFPAAVASLGFELACIVRQWRYSSLELNLHMMAEFLWFLGNASWMAGDLLFEDEPDPGELFPWYDGPIWFGNEFLAEAAKRLGNVCWTIGLILLFRCYIGYALEYFRRWRSSGKTEDAAEATQGPIVEPKVYELFFICPWIIKDTFWIEEMPTGALISAAVTSALILDNLRRTGEPRFVAEFVWVIGNTMWVIAELILEDEENWPRELSCAVILAGCIPLLYVCGKRPRRVEESAEPVPQGGEAEKV